jgi:hypothetical protein
MIKIGGLFAVVGGACLVSGWGGAGGIAPVSGVVKLNGKPVAGVELLFQPVTGDSLKSPGPAATGVTGADGRYVLKTIGEGKAGATVGKNHVLFSAKAPVEDFSEDGKKRGKPAVAIPARYSSDAKMEFDVPPGGTNSANFELKTP